MALVFKIALLFKLTDDINHSMIMTEPLTEHWYWEVVATCPCDQEELFSYYLFEENVLTAQEVL